MDCSIILVGIPIVISVCDSIHGQSEKTIDLSKNTNEKLTNVTQLISLIVLPCLHNIIDATLFCALLTHLFFNMFARYW